WTPFAWIVERTCRIGAGIKAASHGQVLREEFLALPESLQRSQGKPLLPLIGHVFVSHSAKPIVVWLQPLNNRLLPKIFLRTKIFDESFRQKFPRGDSSLSKPEPPLPALSSRSTCFAVATIDSLPPRHEWGEGRGEGQPLSCDD